MIIYTDGSAHPNPGPGGFGVIVLDNDEKIQYIYNKQFEKEKVTNNQMELKAILYAFLNYGVNINTNEFTNSIPIICLPNKIVIDFSNDNNLDTVM